MRSERVRNRGDVTKVTKEQPGTHMCSYVPCFQALICNNSSKTEARDRFTVSLPVQLRGYMAILTSSAATWLCGHPHFQCIYAATWPSLPPLQQHGYMTILTSSAATWLHGSYPCSHILWRPDEVLSHVDDSIITQKAEEQPGEQLLPHLVLIHSQPSMMEKWGWELGQGSEEMAFY